MTFYCDHCRRTVSSHVPLPDHLPSSARCIKCRAIMRPIDTPRREPQLQVAA